MNFKGQNIIKASRNIIVLGTPSPMGSVFKGWWEKTEKRMRSDPSYLPIKAIPKEELDKMIGDILVPCIKKEYEEEFEIELD